MVRTPEKKFDSSTADRVISSGVHDGWKPPTNHERANCESTPLVRGGAAGSEHGTRRADGQYVCPSPAIRSVSPPSVFGTVGMGAQGVVLG